MGKKRGKRKHHESSDKKSGKVQPGPLNYESAVKDSEDFEKYYKLQKICPEEEWDAFLKALKSELPTAFRITGTKSESKAMLKIVQGTYFNEVLNAGLTDGDEPIQPICLPWYPDSLAWQLKLTRRDIRRSEPLSKLHSFLISETASGNISRQETVSMIPPIALDVKPHHKVLDLCAAPGSKTAQLIESLHQGEERMPSGFVVANDVDNKRCYMLVHQAKRLNSPNVIITNHDATIMPNFIVSNKDGGEEFLKFDRILCDVPCSGDGTMRKNPDIWAKWNAANGANLHGIQFRIVKRSCEMLAVGGRAVYSTCSLNPIENEAVIARLLTEAKGSLKIVDASSLLPGLKHNPGMTTWTVASRDMVTYKTPDEVADKWKSSISSNLFPPSAEEAERLDLKHCIRVLPHQQDTGGFFIVVIEKVKLLPWESGAKNGAAEDGNAASKEDTSVQIKEPARKRRRFQGYKEDPYIFFQPDEPLWPDLKKYYSLSDDFPSSCLLTRCKEGKRKNIYLTSPEVQDIIKKNCERIKIINTGVKTFARCDTKETKCVYRLVQEGLWSTFPFIGKDRHIVVGKEDLLSMLTVEDLSKPPLIESLSEPVKKRMAEIGAGSCVLIYEDTDESDSPLHLELVGWIGAVSARAYVPKSDCVHYIRLMGGDTSMFEVNNKYQIAKANPSTNAGVLPGEKDDEKYGDVADEPMEDSAVDES